MRWCNLSKFPILAAVAQSVRSQRYGTVSQFAATSNINYKVVDELIKLHKLPTLNERIEYLTDVALRDVKALEDETETPGVAGRAGVNA